MHTLILILVCFVVRFLDSIFLPHVLILSQRIYVPCMLDWCHITIAIGNSAS